MKQKARIKSKSNNIEEYAIEVYDYLIYNKKNTSSTSLISEFFLPGTITVSNKFNNLHEKDDKENFKIWIVTLVKDFYNSLLDTETIAYDYYDSDELGNLIVEILTYKITEYNSSVIDIASIQQTTDIINRIVKIVLFSDQFFPIHINKDFNELGKNVCFHMLNTMDSLPLKDQIRFSVISGTVGYDVKNSYKSCIPSKLTTDNIIKFFDNGKKISNSTIEDLMLKKLNDNFVIDHINDFLHDVSQPNTKLVFFTDDYIESIFDMKIILNLLEFNSTLEITLVPRNGQYANDFSYFDAIDILEMHSFNKLKEQLNGRFNVFKNGPKGSGISPLEFSDELIALLLGCTLILFKGARVFEMVQGINKKSYFTFNVIHEQSANLTGISTSNAPSVFVKQNANNPLFKIDTDGTVSSTVDILENAKNY